jgi:hypothetical protein
MVHEQETKTELRIQLASLKARMRAIQGGQARDWAQALMDFPPPGYVEAVSGTSTFVCRLFVARLSRRLSHLPNWFGSDQATNCRDK